MITGLVFFIIGGALVVSLLTGIIKLISHDFSQEPLSGSLIFKMFKITILSFIYIMIHVIWVMPWLKNNGYE